MLEGVHTALKPAPNVTGTFKNNTLFGHFVIVGGFQNGIWGHTSVGHRAIGHTTKTNRKLVFFLGSCLFFGKQPTKNRRPWLTNPTRRLYNSFYYQLLIGLIIFLFGFGYLDARLKEMPDLSFFQPQECLHIIIICVINGIVQFRCIGLWPVDACKMLNFLSLLWVVVGIALQAFFRLANHNFFGKRLNFGGR